MSARTGQRAQRVTGPACLVADPDPLARRALTDSLRADGGFAVIGQASDGVEAVELARHYRPDIVLLATGPAGPRRGRPPASRSSRTSPETRVVMLATAPDLELEMRAVRAGASGFVVKSDEIDVDQARRWRSSPPATRSSRPS